MVEVQKDPIKRTFKTASGTYEIPVDSVEGFLKDFPDAQELKSFKVGEAQYDIPMGEETSFLKDFPDAKPLYEVPAPPTEYDGLQPVAAFNRAVVTGAAAIPKTVGILAARLNKLFGDDRPAEELPTYQFGQYLEDKALEYGITATDPAKEDSFLETTIPAAFGSVASIALTGGLGSAPAKFGAAAPTVMQTAAQALTNPSVVAGGAQMGASEFEQAKKAGVSDDEAFNVFLQNYLVGQTEAIPLQRAFSRLNKISGGKLVEVAKAGAQGGLEEATQEIIQQTITNKVAQDTYDPKRDLFQDVAKSGGAGFVVGFILPGVGVAMKSMTPEQKAATKEELNTLLKEEQVAREKAKIATEAVEQITAQLPTEITSAQDQVAAEVEQLTSTLPESGQESGQTVPTEKPRIRVRGELGENTETIPEGDQLKTNLQGAIQKLDNARIASLPTGRISVPRTKVTVDEMAALKDVIRREAAAAKGGVKVVKEALGSITSQITETIDGLRLPAKKVTTIINRIGKTNLLNPLHVARLEKYVEKVATDQVYADKVQQAENLQSDIKGKLTKYTSQQKDPVKQLASIKIDDVSDIDEFISVATKALAPTKQVEGEAYAPLETKEVTDYLDREIPKITQFIESNMEVLPTDEELTGPNIGIKLGQMATERLDNLQKQVSPGLITSDRVIADLRGIDLTALAPKQLRDLVRTLDNIAVNEDLGGAGQIGATAFQSQNSPKIVTPAAKIIESMNLFFGKEAMQFSTWLNRITGNSSAAADFQAYSNINNVTGKNAIVEKGKDDILKNWQKVSPVQYFSHDNHVILSQFAELMQYETTAQEGFDIAKANIEQGLETARTNNFSDLATEEAQWNKLKDFTTPEQAAAYMKKSHPQLYKQWEFLVDYFAKIEPDLAANKEIMYGEKLLKVHNYIPFRTLDITNNQEALEDIGEVERLLNPEYAVKPKASPTTISRVKQLPEGKIRDRRLLSVVVDRYAKSLYDIHVSYEVLRAGKTLNAIKPQLAKSGVIDAFNTLVKQQRGITEKQIPLERVASEILTQITEIGYITGLGGITPGILQFGSAMTSTVTDLTANGHNPMLFFKPNAGSEKVRNQYSIGRRLNHMGGLSEVKQANLRVKGAYEKGLNKVAQKYEWLKAKVAKVSLASQVYLDFVAAKQAWNAQYLAKLKELGVDINNIDWAQEATLQTEETRRRAAAYAEQKTDELLGASAVEKRAVVLNSKNVASRLFKAINLPFATYMLNFKQRTAMAVGKIAYGNDTKAGFKELTTLTAEATMVAMVLRPLAGMVQENITDVMRNLYDYPEDEEDKEKREAMKFKLQLQNLYKDMMPWAINQYLGDKSLDFLNLMAYFGAEEAEDMTFKEWKKELRDSGEDAPFVVYEQPGQQLGMIGIVIEQLSGVKEFAELNMKDSDTLIVTDRYGNEVEVDLDERTRDILNAHGFISFASLFGVNMRELKTSTRQMRNQIIKENK